MLSLEQRAERPDGISIAFGVRGSASAPGVLLTYPWSPGNARYMAEVGGPDAESLSRNVGQLLDRLAARARVAVFDYPRGLGGTTGPGPRDLTVTTVIEDYLAIADAAGLRQFIVLGYSWSASAAIQVAGRTSRCKALVIGGWPPIGSPHAELRDACRALAADRHDPRRGLAGMYATYYQSVIDDDPDVSISGETRAVLFYGTADTEPMAQASGSVRSLIVRNQDVLAAQGWRLIEVPGRDHAGCMSADVVAPIALSVISDPRSGAWR